MEKDLTTYYYYLEAIKRAIKAIKLIFVFE